MDNFRRQSCLVMWPGFLLMAFGCTAPNPPLESTLSSPFFTPVALTATHPAPTLTPSAPTLTATSTPSPTSGPTSTVSPTPTSSVTPEPSLTPLPTLSPAEAMRLTRGLLEDNSGCRLPCWWGIIPGETSWQEARQFLAPFATKIEQGGSGVIVEDGDTYQTTNYSVTYDIAGVPLGGGALFSIKNGMISSIYVGPASTVQSWKLHQLLTDFGEPEKILLKTYPNTPELYLPFRLVLFYANHRILAFYEYEAQQEGDLLQGCPLPVGPELWLWGPNEVWTEKDIEEIVSGPDSPNPLRSLEEVTDISIDDFFQAFKNPESNSCIYTPVDFWP